MGAERQRLEVDAGLCFPKLLLCRKIGPDKGI